MKVYILLIYFFQHFILSQNEPTNNNHLSLRFFHYKVNELNYEVGAKVRKIIKELGETMPEDLHTSRKSVKQIEE
ncbi:hypothetical protein psyc5s11_07260 [Clostridium gelidum]|uniref:Uncharacterized protein n=1 Tax=Clostridium gelidum TaxID=704125 RepID=A0ABM7SYI5_9CLOT|nr:hypothetical protein psyc5s11_07260 [Clostridium gelidum]